MSLLGIDIGTTGCKAVAFNLQGRQLAISYREYEIISKKEGYAELDSNVVWEKVLATIRDVAQQTTSDPVEALSVSSLGEAMVPVSSDGKILGNSILGTDCRGEEYVQHLLDKFTPYEVYKLTGNLPDTFNSMSKIAWIKNSMPNLYHSTAYFLTWADFICFMLGGNPVTNYSLAGRSLMFDIYTNNWSNELIQILGLDKNKLAPPCPSGSHLGYVTEELGKELNFKNRVAIVSGGHDQCCAALGSGINSSSQSAMYGLGTFICVVSVFGEVPDVDYMFEKRMHIEPHVIPGSYITFVYNQSGGALIKWFKNVFGGERITYTTLFEEVPGTANSILVTPKFGATGPPDFHNGNQGCFSGLTLGHTRGDILQAILEGTVFYVRDCFEKSEEIFAKTNSLVATGGGSLSDKWLQITADILDKEIFKNKVTEASSLGAAIIAGVGSKMFVSFDEAVHNMVQKETVIIPDRTKEEYYTNKFEQYKIFYNYIL